MKDPGPTVTAPPLCRVCNRAYDHATTPRRTYYRFAHCSATWRPEDGMCPECFDRRGEGRGELLRCMPDGSFAPNTPYSRRVAAYHAGEDLSGAQVDPQYKSNFQR
jgi:hypothetical protein